MKILFLNPEAQLGGAEKCLLDLLRGLGDALPGASAHLITLAEGPLLDMARACGAQAHAVRAGARLSQVGDSAVRWRGGAVGALSGAASSLASIPDVARLVAELRGAIAALQPDFIHSNGIKCHVLSRLAAPHIPTIWHLHDFVGKRPLSSRLLRALGRGVHAVANSEAVRWDAAATLSATAVSRIYNGVDLDEFRPAPEPSEGALLDRLAGLEPRAGIFRIGLVATYARWKGHDVFLRSLPLLLERTKAPLRFYLVGGALYRSSGSQHSASDLVLLAKRLGVEASVGFVPFQDDAATVYRSLDIVVHASTEPEPFGRTIAEAMACGRPVVASPLGGSQELFRDGHDAVACAPGDPERLATALARLISLPLLRYQLSAEARRTALLRFDSRRYVREFSCLYRSLLTESAGPRVTVAMGYREDGWRSMKQLTEGTARELHERLPIAPSLFAPSLRRYPRWIDRRILYPSRLPTGDILHLTDHSYADCLLRARRRFGRLVVVVHDLAFWTGRRWWNAYYRRRIVSGLRSADALIAVSRAVALEMRRELGLSATAIIPSAVPLDRFPHTDSPRVPGQLLNVGETSHRKGVDRLLRLLALLPDEYHLVRIGSPMSPGLVRLARELGVLQRIEERGPADHAQLLAAYRSAWAVVVPSRYEGYGLPVVEARLTGTPVLADGAVPSVSLLGDDPGTTALDFSAFDPAGDVDARRAEATKLEHLRGRAVELTDRDRFGWPAVAEQYRQVYECLTPSPRESVPSSGKKRRR